MTYEQFFYWLKGFIDVNNGAPTEAQWENIKKKMDEMSATNQKLNNFLTRQSPSSDPFQPVRNPITDKNIWLHPYPDSNNMIGLTRDGVGIITAQQKSQS